MKPLIVLFLCLIATSAAAQQYEFRGDFVETYMAEDGFLDTVPSGTTLNCEQQLCSSSKSVRIYVFKNKETTKRFWSTDYCDVMFDGPDAIASCGPTGHVVYYDETGQLMHRYHLCHTAEDKRISAARY